MNGLILHLILPNYGLMAGYEVHHNPFLLLPTLGESNSRTGGWKCWHFTCNLPRCLVTGCECVKIQDMMLAESLRAGGEQYSARHESTTIFSLTWFKMQNCTIVDLHEVCITSNSRVQTTFNKYDYDLKAQLSSSVNLHEPFYHQVMPRY